MNQITTTEDHFSEKRFNPQETLVPRDYSFNFNATAKTRKTISTTSIRSKPPTFIAKMIITYL